MNKIDLFLNKYNKEFLKTCAINNIIKKRIQKLFQLVLKIKKNKKKNYYCWQWWKCSYS